MRRAVLLSLAGVAAGLLAPPAARAQSDENDGFSAPRTATVDARGARAVEIEAHAGMLRVVGVPGLAEVRVRGTARAGRRDRLAGIRLDARREGDAVVVRADLPDQDWRGWSGRDDWRLLDLVVEVPRGLAARIEDGSGSVEVRGVGALTLHDGSGGVEVDDVASADIEDGSGSLRVRDVRGDLRVRDGSGSVEAERVGGTFTVERDGSGSIDAREVAGDFVVERDGSGGIDHDGVRGRVTIPRRR
ncbi:MAG: hypothetical protein AVDCRST_MAG11-3639 [uncultured Gemmatimonadaceae bacterium]|uniref:Adhesin domain-containing protein n=1 Tax=uncultured Gemmatimonadaceae bacterium TaxID=246130 RepID=A0A6J4MB58_9BACT|nr:MAG: hypothetical protein AVDCRST_MAG11-3639 [uncultured Gemmatimonadaceae bacterium]